MPAEHRRPAHFAISLPAPAFPRFHFANDEPKIRLSVPVVAALLRPARPPLQNSAHRTEEFRYLSQIRSARSACRAPPSIPEFVAANFLGCQDHARFQNLARYGLRFV